MVHPKRRRQQHPARTPVLKVAFNRSTTITGLAYQRTRTLARKPNVRRCAARHICALLLLICFGILPISFFFKFTSDPWTPRDISCDSDHFSVPQNNSGKPAIQGLFTIDQLVLDMPFVTAKLIDTIWDLVVGRGGQLAAWVVSYIVFTKAMLRAIEGSPTPYRTFLGLSMEGVSVGTLWNLLRDLFRHRTKRTTALFSYIVVSSIWVLALPTLLSAMTGYVSTSKAYLHMENSTLVPMNALESGMIFWDGKRIGLKNGSCVVTSVDDDSSLSTLSSDTDQRASTCPCRLPNGTVVDPKVYLSIHDFRIYDSFNYYPSGFAFAILPYDPLDCKYDLKNNETFNATGYVNGKFSSYIQTSCSTPLNLTFQGRNYSIDAGLNYTEAQCYGNTGQGFTYTDIYELSTCLPNTDDSAYQWGYSRMLTALVVIFQFVWAATMYAVWLDAILNSELVKQGFRMTQLKGAFALAAAAQRKMEMEAEELIREDVRTLDRELFKPDSAVPFDLLKGEKVLSQEEDERHSADYEMR